MNNLWIKVAWITSIILGLTGMSRQVVDACQTISKEDKSRLLIAQNSSVCHQIEEGYQEVHAFETQNVHISICRYNQQFYYHRKSKHNPNHTVLLPAENILNGNVFQAVDGRKTYIVGTNTEGYYSSVMHENNEIIFEPELQQSTLMNNKLRTEIKSFKRNLNQNNWLKCYQNHTNSYQYGWQQLIVRPYPQLS